MLISGPGGRTGSPIPSSIGKLTLVTATYWYGNGHTGQVPASMAQVHPFSGLAAACFSGLHPHHSVAIDVSEEGRHFAVYLFVHAKHRQVHFQSLD